MNGVQECTHAPESSRCDVTPGPRLSCSWPQSGHVNIDMWSSCLTSSHRHVVRPDSGMSGCFDPVTRPKNRLAVLHSQSMRIGLIVAVGASALFLAGCGTEPKRGPALTARPDSATGEVYGPHSDLTESAPPGKPLGGGPRSSPGATGQSHPEYAASLPPATVTLEALPAPDLLSHSAVRVAVTFAIGQERQRARDVRSSA